MLEEGGLLSRGIFDFDILIFRPRRAFAGAQRNGYQSRSSRDVVDLFYFILFYFILFISPGPATAEQGDLGHM